MAGDFFKKNKDIIILMFILVVEGLILCFPISKLYPNSICIRDNLGNERYMYDSNIGIQKIMDEEVSYGDTVILGSGTYKESFILIPEGVSLTAKKEDLGSVILSGDPNNPIDTVIGLSSHSSVKNLIICHGGAGLLICSLPPFFSSPKEISIEHNLIMKNKNGLIINEHSEDIEIIGNTITHNEDRGIWISTNPNGPIILCKENIVAYNEKGIGIEFMQQDDQFSEIPIYLDLFNLSLFYNDFYDNIYQTACYIDTNRKNSQVIIPDHFGQGNFTKKPYFVDPNNGDFHLSSYSPCIDQGDPNSDFSSEPEKNGKRVNIGFWGNSNQATPTLDTDKDGILDYSEGPIDIDKDGLFDWKDKDTTIFPLTFESDSIAIHIEGISWDTNQKIQFKEAQVIPPRELSIDPPKGIILFDAIRYKIVNLDKLDMVTIKLVFPKDKAGKNYGALLINHHISYMALSSDSLWTSIPFFIDTNAIDDPNMNAILLNLEDGAAGDNDVIKNGIIEHTGLVIIDPKPLIEWKEPKGCFLSICNHQLIL